ncbi:unnamed protein product [Linum trigynum]|uniref:RNase H type-1 domain-containing protein n=1 Tax=Linum trigynum TaxID=586398 RepID=A0AAV2DUH5_9ROSI
MKSEEDPSSLRFKAFCLWNIWKARNEFVFRGITMSPMMTSIFAFREASEPFPAHPSRCPNHQSRGIPPQSSPPQRDPAKRINCDGSFDHGSQEAAFGIVITDSQGHICDGKAGKVICSSPIEVKALSLVEACRFAASDNTPTVIFTDCKSLVDESMWPWRCFGLLSHIKTILRQCHWIHLSFTHRRFNLCADWVARNARCLYLPRDWISVLSIVAPLL